MLLYTRMGVQRGSDYQCRPVWNSPTCARPGASRRATSSQRPCCSRQSSPLPPVRPALWSAGFHIQSSALPIQPLVPMRCQRSPAVKQAQLCGRPAPSRLGERLLCQAHAEQHCGWQMQGRAPWPRLARQPMRLMSPTWARPVPAAVACRPPTSCSPSRPAARA